MSTDSVCSDDALDSFSRMYDEAFALVQSGVAQQKAGNEGAHRTLSRAVEIMENALKIEFSTDEEQDAAESRSKKMRRYIEHIKTQQTKSALIGGRRTNQKDNIIDFESPTIWYQPVIQLLTNNPSYGDLFERMQSLFGFQAGNVLNQKEHLVLLLTNYRHQLETSEKEEYQTPAGADPQRDMDMTNKAVSKFHVKLFDNYKKWCRYVSQKFHFSKDQLVDIVLFFLIWGEAGNFRQTPELLCFLFHKMAPVAHSSLGSNHEGSPPNDFLVRVIRPMYDELSKDASKRTMKGARSPHEEVRNYDDFNEFFWSKKCLKYDMYTIGQAFAMTNKKGDPKVVKKTFKEKRSWFRALRSFRRVFFFNCALFLATFGFAANVTLFCPDSPIMYGQDLKNPVVFGKTYISRLIEKENDQIDQETDEDSPCLVPKLASCLGIQGYTKGLTFSKIPVDFKGLLGIVPFHDCSAKTSGRCGCYIDTIDKCFGESGVTTVQINDEEKPTYKKKRFDQSRCFPTWKRSVLNIINNKGTGKLNCGICQLTLDSLINNFKLPELLSGLLDFGRSDSGPLLMLGGLGALGLVIVLEIQNRFFSTVGIGFVGRKLPVPCGAYCRYTCFWLLLFIIKLLFDYEFMVKSLVETSFFIWAADKNDYLQYSQFLIQQSYHNVLYILLIWLPAFIVFMYDAQIFYAILSVVFGSIKGFNLRIGEVRSFRILRLTFKSIPSVFNQKIVPNISDMVGKKKRSKRSKKASDQGMPIRRFERVSYSSGSKPLTVKTQKYSSLLEQRDDDGYSEMKTPHGIEEDAVSSSRSSSMNGITGVSGALFERTIPFAMAWNRCLASLREADVISNRELNVLSYLIDSSDTEDRRLYPPAFLTAGKLDESIDIVSECYALYEKLKPTKKKKKDKTCQKIEQSMTERLLKDDLRIEALLGSYKFTSQVIRILLGENHKELDDVFSFFEEMVVQQQILYALNLSNLYEVVRACACLMNMILNTPKNVSEKKFQRSLYSVIDAVENVFNVMKVVLSKQEPLVEILNQTPLNENSFFFPGDHQHYASMQLEKMVNDQTTMDIVSRAYQLLSVDNLDAEPRSEEGRRRLRFFVNSLFMNMPEAKAVRQMHSFSISTPYYNEIVMYSIKDLTTQNNDMIKLLFYLQTIYPFEWENFLERLGAKDAAEVLKRFPEEVRLWASYRGQTLARTVRGMMYNEEAIRFLHWLEIGENEPMHLKGCNCNRCKQLDDMVSLKFNYVCTCQIYGLQKDQQKQQAIDIEYLLEKHSNLRVAYVDGPKKVKDGPPRFYSVLVRHLNGRVSEVYRVELPGNPIVGEGKPENQNHAIIFSRGELLQCIDMNQDGYLEECLKMPNLLATIDRHSPKHPLTIIGFREHIFTGGVSNLASFMSIQELSFVSLGQRMLAMFHVRQHYGHPDIFDKVFAMTTGGTAKASKGINLSEDIFAGFNSTLRGGRITHEEFIQVGKGRDVGMQQLALFEAKLSSGAGESVLSRDVMRMANRLDFFRLQSWFYGNLGWYFTQTMTVAAIYVFIYGKLYTALSGLDNYFLQRGGLGIGGTLNTSWALQMGFLLAVPVMAVVGVERGFRHGTTYLLWNVMTLGPIFFTFQMGTRMHYFDRTLIHGGAKYRATGRGFTIKHEKFAELFRFYCFSHFQRGVELAFLLILYAAYGTFSWCNCSWLLDKEFYNNIQPTDLEWTRRCYANHYQTCVLPTNQNYGMITFSLWIIASTWMWGPFFFNPSGLDWGKIIVDYNDWQNWLRTMNDSSESWFGWWNTEMEYLEHSSRSARFVVILRKSRFLLLAFGIYLQMAYNTYYKRRDLLIKQTDLAPYVLAGGLLAFIFIFIWVGYACSRMAKKNAKKQRKLRKTKFYTSFTVMVILLLSLTVLTLTNIIEIMIIFGLITYWVVEVSAVRLQYHHLVVRALARGYHRFVGWVVFGPIMFVAMFLPFISAFQQRVMFNNAFTAGLEVSKLFANDAAPSSVVKVKRTKKKVKRDD